MVGASRRDGQRVRQALRHLGLHAPSPPGRGLARGRTHRGRSPTSAASWTRRCAGSWAGCEWRRASGAGAGPDLPRPRCGDAVAGRRDRRCIPVVIALRREDTGSEWPRASGHPVLEGEHRPLRSLRAVSARHGPVPSARRRKPGSTISWWQATGPTTVSMQGVWKVPPAPDRWRPRRSGHNEEERTGWVGHERHQRTIRSAPMQRRRHGWCERYRTLASTQLGPLSTVSPHSSPNSLPAPVERGWRPPAGAGRGGHPRRRWNGDDGDDPPGPGWGGDDAPERGWGAVVVVRSLGIRPVETDPAGRHATGGRFVHGLHGTDERSGTPVPRCRPLVPSKPRRPSNATCACPTSLRGAA